MGLIASKVRVVPASIPAAGGTVNFKFEARATGASTHQETKYSIPDTSPYVFSPPGDPAAPRVIWGAVCPVTVDPADYDLDLTLAFTEGPHQMSVTINADIYEVDAGGNRVVLASGEPKPPKRLTGIVTIQ